MSRWTPLPGPIRSSLSLYPTTCRWFPWNCPSRTSRSSVPAIRARITSIARNSRFFEQYHVLVRSFGDCVGVESKNSRPFDKTRPRRGRDQPSHGWPGVFGTNPLVLPVTFCPFCLCNWQRDQCLQMHEGGASKALSPPLACDTMRRDEVFLATHENSVAQPSRRGEIVIQGFEPFFPGVRLD